MLYTCIVKFDVLCVSENFWKFFAKLNRGTAPADLFRARAANRAAVGPHALAPGSNQLAGQFRGAPLGQVADRVRLKSQSLGGYADWGRLVSVVACA